MVRSRSLLWSFNYAIEGIVYALRTQRNMRLHVVAATAVLAACLVLRIGGLSLVAIFFAVTMVLVTELVNTAIEATVDLATERLDPLAKTAKDVAAGAVFVASLNAVVVAYLVLFDPVRMLVQQGMNWVRVGPSSLTVIALGLVGLAVLVLKAASREGTFMRGGWPSGHTALAVAAATALGFITGSASAFVLALFIAGLVAQSRVESEAHTIPQVIVGAFLGLLLSTAVFQLFFT
ncbi:MAG: phosphatase PAP2 family protein [Coriobacteriia bacterium]|nr:phosphatase PAP2 family protein [Coriobacteriia bacterium]